LENLNPKVLKNTKTTELPKEGKLAISVITEEQSGSFVEN